MNKYINFFLNVFCKVKFPTGAWGKIFAKVGNFTLQKTFYTYNTITIAVDDHDSSKLDIPREHIADFL